MIAHLLEQIMTPGCGGAVIAAAGGHFIVDLLLYAGVGGFAFFTGRKVGHKRGHKCSTHHGK
jgi:hypothetical protein